MLNNTNNEKESNLYFLKPILISMIAGMVSIFILFIIFAVLMASNAIPLSIIHTLTTVAGAAGGFISGFICGKIIHRQGVLFGAVCGVLLSLLIVISGFFAFGFSMQAYTFVKFIAIISASSIGGIIGVNTR